MDKAKYSREARIARHRRVRRKVEGTADRPRLCVFRSLAHIYAQVIDDGKRCTLVSASSLEPEMKTVTADTKKGETARLVGKKIAERAMQAGITNVVFDRGGFLYHGRVKSLADGAREVGLKF